MESVSSRVARWGVAAVCAFAIGIPAVGWADDKDRTRDQDRTGDQDRDLLQLRDQIHKDTNLSQQVLDALDPDLKEYLKNKGDANQVREMVRTAVKSNCTGTCLGEMVRTMNHAMTQGVGDKQARNMVENALSAQIRERDQKRLTLSEQELGDKVRARVQERLATMDQEKTKTQDRDRIRDMEHAPGAPGGGGKGGR